MGDYPAVQYCVHISAQPEVFQAIQSTVAPDPDDCGDALVDCTGLPSDFHIPLENELTSDGDQVESSWRHYLSIAQAAADEADQLGEALIQHGLERDMRQEQAISDLTSICGVALNISDIPERDGGACTADAQCSAGYRCQGVGARRCVLDPVLYATTHVAAANRDRLASCLGASNVSYAVLGNTQVCAWDYGDASSACRGATPEQPCPYELSGPTCSAPSLPADAMRQVRLLDGMAAAGEPTEALLSLFHMPDETEGSGATGTDTQGAPPCAALAAWRNATSPPGHPEFLTSSRFFSQSTLSQLAQTISWSAAVGDFSSVSINDTRVITTGSAVGNASAMPPSGGPCATSSSGGWPADDRCGHLFELAGAAGGRCPSGARSRPGDAPQRSLFCHWPDATDSSGALGHREQRAQMNDMLARAVLAARLIGGAPLSHGALEVPHYGRIGNPSVEVVEAEWNQRDAFFAPPSGTGFVRTTTAGQIITHGIGDFGEYGGSFISDYGGRAYRIGPTFAYGGSGPGSYPDGVEWRRCPYDRAACIEVFDDAADVDDPTAEHADTWDRNMPLVIRRLSGSVDGPNPLQFADAIWSGGGRTDLGGASIYAGLMDRVFASAHSAPYDLAVDATDGMLGDDPLAQTVTEYWRRQPACNFDVSRLVGGTCNAAELEYEQQHCDHNSSLSSCGYVGCRPHDDGSAAAYYWCSHRAAQPGLNYLDSLEANRAFIAQQGLTNTDMLNGLELLCYAAETQQGGASLCTGNMPQVESMADAFRASSYLDCQAADLRRHASRAMLTDLPTRVVQVVQASGTTVYGEDTGEFGAAVDQVRAGLVNLTTAEAGIASDLHAMSGALTRLRSAVQNQNLEQQISALQLESAAFDRITSCAAGLADAAGQGTGAPAAYAGAAIQCANAGVQIVLAAQLSQLHDMQAQLALQDAFTRFDDEFNAANQHLGEQAAAISSALENISAGIATIRNQQMGARRALARALFLDTDETGQVMAASNVMRERYDTDLVRYTEAHHRAVRLAAIARVALEQRLGMTLRSMTAELVTVEAPADWADDICRLPSIDYDSVSGRSGTGSSMAAVPPDDYSGTYVGDYVRRLAQVFESYNFAYPFQDGTDRTVVSLRDELLGVRASCPVAGPNLLFQTSDLRADRIGGELVWLRENCEERTGWDPDGGVYDAGVGSVIRATQPSCVSVQEIDPAVEGTGDVPLPHGSTDAVTGGGAGAFRVFFGNHTGSTDDPVAPPGASCESGCNGITAATRYVQWIALPDGDYTLSWYARRTPVSVSSGATRVDPDKAVSLLTRSPSGVVGTISATVTAATQVTAGGWTRYWAHFTHSDASEVGVALRAGGGGSDEYSVADVSGIMLTARHEGDTEPAVYWSTSEVLTHDEPVCEDTAGRALRDQGFVYGCETVCPAGYGTSCDPGQRASRCYYEASFALGADALERLTGRGGGGFAGGNYNYRIETLGLNLVGTGIRDCSQSSTPSTCYASAGVSYSLLHTGQFPVRNARGEDYLAPLFPGRIESARALAAERYITNPVSSADEILSDQYGRVEFRGRPLGGLFTLRIWDDGGLVFSNVEDVQFVIGYRYWTRQQ
ncbi:MAG: hypothetical protein U0234_26255 [Sandaracinus sp.]